MTVVTGENGAGKTSLIEAVGYLSTLRSFRGSPREALVRSGAPHALVRAELAEGSRRIEIRAEITPGRRDEVRCNGQRVTRVEQLLEVLQVTVFTPDDLALVKGAPEGRRHYLDELLEGSRPRGAALRREVERILRQRNTLLKQAGGRASAEVLATLDIWDEKLAHAGTTLVTEREQLVAELAPYAAAAFSRLSTLPAPLELSYARSFPVPLAAALAAARDDDLRRQVTTVGPQRDDLVVSSGGLDARTRLSQGQQRSATLALRLAGHEVTAARRGARPVLLLDDAFSELDTHAATALLHELPSGQAILTTAHPLPAGAHPAAVLDLVAGELHPR